MKKKTAVVFIVAVLLITPVSKASAEWTNLFKGILEVDIRAVSANPKNPDILFAASEKNLYQSTDKGENWKKIYSIRGNSSIQTIFVDPANTDAIYVGSQKGIARSLDGGRHWEGKAKAGFSDDNPIFCIEANAQFSNLLWVGTEKGLFEFNKEKGSLLKVDSFPSTLVQSILDSKSADSELLVSADKGLYKSADRGAHWQRIDSSLAPEREDEIETLGQFDIEQIMVSPLMGNLIYVPGHQSFYAATQKGILKSVSGESTWNFLDSGNFPDKAVHSIVSSRTTFYIGTNQGVFRWNKESGSFSDTNDGLLSKEIQALYFDQNEEFMLAATKKGLFRYSYPEISFDVKQNHESVDLKMRDIMSAFKDEPTIGDVQKAAIEYAEVHPRKIEEWRKAASRKALLPNVSVNRSVNSDQNIDLDRGGTADPDHFIQGPNESSYDWSVGVSWDLGDLIWNNDQTSIDTRSRLMVELRDDVLTEVTHLYYERRRLEVEILLHPPKELPTILEKQLKLEELTASLDALTGGDFSKRLKPAASVFSI